MKTLREPLSIGAAVKRRGPFEPVGVVIDKRDHWCSVAWPETGPRMPRICDERELERVSPA